MTVKELRTKLYAFADDTEIEIVQDITTIESIRESRTRGILGIMKTQDVELEPVEDGVDVSTTVNERALLIVGVPCRGEADEA